ncbi:MAG TPA: RNA polymerase sigma factor [Steroidobacteraceae bacterium]|jgi:RNA polymerase sigma-70 factor (ECF subfamily)|nr:RNA polymerase sigma factor [Steroidobacteraceae bacterium]
MPAHAAESMVEEVFRRESGRVLATLIRLLGEFDLAEEARQDAFTAAVEQWAATGVPANPRAWLISTGRNKAVDRIRRDAVFRSRIQGREIASAEADAAAVLDESDDSAFGDDRLRLIFTCCHPALSSEAQIALTLREVCGLTTQAVARAFLVGEETMAQRLVRAKKKIRDAGIPYETPEPPLFNQRIQGVLAVVYGVFTEGYAVTTGTRLVDAELCGEAIRLGRLLDELLPRNSAVLGLLALMLLHDARRPARESHEGDVILLEDQDRTLWDQAKITEGLALVDRALNTPGQLSTYAVQAAIAALHVRAQRKEETDWPQIVGLYEVLLRLQPSPVIELNHAVAVSMVDGAARGLDLVDSLRGRGQVNEYHLLHAARGRFLQQLGRLREAGEAYRTALGFATLGPERRLLAARIASIEKMSAAMNSGAACRSDVSGV